MKFANFKRKIANEEIPPEKILKRYRIEFPNAKIKAHLLEWRHCNDLHTLHDKHTNETRFLVSDKTRPLLICGDRIKKYKYKDEAWIPDALPKLCSGSLLSIFRHLNGIDLLQCRLVCKEWNRLCTNHKSLWALPKLPDLTRGYWPNYSPFRAYVKHMFLNCTDAAVVDFFFVNPAFFHYICTLWINDGKHHQLKFSAQRTWIIVDRFMLVKHGNQLFRDGGRVVEIQAFLKVYRKRIEK